MVEVMVTSCLLVTGLLALTMTSVASFQLERTERERNQAANAMRSVMDHVNALSDAVLEDPQGWSTAVTDMFSSGQVPGNSILVAGLQTADNQPAEASIMIVVDETLTDSELGTELGMPRDLDGDGLIESNDVSGAATLLPAIISLTWKGSGGSREIKHAIYLLGV